MAFLSRRLALVCALALAASHFRVSRAQPVPPSVEFNRTIDYKACRLAQKSWGVWFRYDCACCRTYWAIRGYDCVDGGSEDTCPGPLHPNAMGKMAFGNPWLESVGYGAWIKELMRCARQPYRGRGTRMTRCRIPNIIDRDDLFVGGPKTSQLPMSIDGRPSDWNPEPPYGP